GRFVRDDERVTATADDVQVHHRDKALDAAGDGGHLHAVSLGTVVALLLAGERHEHDRVVERRTGGGERPCHLDGHRGSRRVVVGGLTDRAVRGGAHAAVLPAHA